MGEKGFHLSDHNAGFICRDIVRMKPDDKSGANKRDKT